MVTSTPGKQWFALSVRAKHEHTVASILTQKGYDVFLPLYKERRQWSDRIKELDLPLFAGYLFCNLDIECRSNPVVTTPGVKHIVGFGNKPEPLDASEVDSIRRVVESRCKAEPWMAALQPGQAVRLTRGPLSGVAGTLIQVKSQRRLVVSVSLLQRSVAVDVESEWCASAASSHPTFLSRPAEAHSVISASNWTR